MAEGPLMDGSVKMPSPERLPRSRGYLRTLRRDQRGQALVEFALVLLPLCLVLFGIVDFARALNYYNDLTQVAGQGARAAAVNADPDGSTPMNKSIQMGVYNNLDSPEMTQGGPGNTAEICITKMPTTTGDPVTVQASYTFHFIPLVHPVSITLKASQTERFEGLSPSYQGGCSP